jgi:hypothetical protein
MFAKEMSRFSSPSPASIGDTLSMLHYVEAIGWISFVLAAATTLAR